MTDLDLDFIDPRKATPGQVADIIALCREQAEELARLRESESFLLAESEQNLAETASLAAERDDARAAIDRVREAVEGFDSGWRQMPEGPTRDGYSAGVLAMRSFVLRALDGHRDTEQEET